MSYLARLRSLEAPKGGTQATAKTDRSSEETAAASLGLGKAPIKRTDKTDKGASVSFVSPSGTPFSTQGADAATDVEWLRSYPCPEGFPPDRWQRLRDGAVRFAEEWADKALTLGWSREELFNVDEPFANVSMQGAAWFIGDSTVTAVTADAITLRTISGATLRLYRRGLQ
jgi:hypothetical protein